MSTNRERNARASALREYAWLLVALAFETIAALAIRAAVSAHERSNGGGR